MGKKSFEVYDPEEGTAEDAKTVETYDADDAAQEVCEELDCYSGEGWRERRVVLVREVGTEKWKRFEVTAEPDVNYTAYEDDEADPLPAEQRSEGGGS